MAPRGWAAARAMASPVARSSLDDIAAHSRVDDYRTCLGELNRIDHLARQVLRGRPLAQPAVGRLGEGHNRLEHPRRDGRPRLRREEELLERVLAFARDAEQALH